MSSSFRLVDVSSRLALPLVFIQFRIVHALPPLGARSRTFRSVLSLWAVSSYPRRFPNQFTFHSQSSRNFNDIGDTTTYIHIANGNATHDCDKRLRRTNSKDDGVETWEKEKKSGRLSSALSGCPLSNFTEQKSIFEMRLAIVEWSVLACYSGTSATLNRDSALLGCASPKMAWLAIRNLKRSSTRRVLTRPRTTR